MRKTARHLACLGMLAALSAALFVDGAAAREFRVADTQSEDYPTVQALLFMGRLVNERTQGRHQIRVFHSRQLGEEKETIEQTRVGAIDMNRTNVAPLGSFIAEANVLALPFLFRSIDHLNKVLEELRSAKTCSRASRLTASSVSPITIPARGRSTTTGAQSAPSPT